MPDNGNQPYDDDDLRQAIEEIEECNAEKQRIQNKANDDKAVVSKRIDTIKLNASKHLNIPRAVLEAHVLRRKKQDELSHVGEKLEGAHREYFEDGLDLFSFFAGEPDDRQARPPERKSGKSIADRAHEREQKEGEEALDALTSVKENKRKRAPKTIN